MKKFILACALFIGSYSVATIPAYAVQTIYASQNLPDDARSITVYEIKQVGGNAWSSRTVSAYYSASENCIYVNEGRRKNQPYSVIENRAYGQENDGRSEYKYYAGGYYFNL